MDGAHEQDGQKNAGHYAGNEHLADVLLRHQTIDDHGNGRGDHDAERAAGRDDTGRERIIVAIGTHVRHRHLGHGGGRRE